MKKVVAIVGSARTKHTHAAVSKLLEHLEALTTIDSEILMLNDYHLEPCLGCKRCFEKGEECCPLNDDRDALVEKLLAADGVILASPSYMFQVSGLLKTLIDRLAFFGHRPQFFDKTFTSIVVQGLPFGGGIWKYLNLVGSCFGFNTVTGSRVVAREPMMPQDYRKMEKTLTKQAKRFGKSLAAASYPVPKLTMLMGFRMGRTTMQLELAESSCDYRYYKEKDWFDADYFYPVRMGLLRRALGRLFDAIGARLSRKRLT